MSEAGVAPAPASTASALGLLEPLGITEQRGLTQSLGKLAQGWKVMRDTEGRVCYLNDDDGSKVYDRPVDLCGTYGCILQVLPSP